MIDRPTLVRTRLVLLSWQQCALRRTATLPSAENNKHLVCVPSLQTVMMVPPTATFLDCGGIGGGGILYLRARNTSSQLWKSLKWLNLLRNSKSDRIATGSSWGLTTTSTMSRMRRVLVSKWTSEKSTTCVAHNCTVFKCPYRYVLRDIFLACVFFWSSKHH